ncbi:MAG: imidazoleglycerol-phosphate dehydratase, partial [Clostridia bacterium]|nr:imidazoleglycerol-phosphate dehydratase [Clostridia bacterium]
MRTAEIKRKTKETDILLKLDLDGCGESDINTGCGFLDHMLTLLAKQARINLSVKCIGDVNVDYHHTVEDVGIALGKAYAVALGDKRGISRYGFFILPMDESLILSSLDFSGRAFLGYDVPLRAKKVGDFDTELAEEFWLGFVRNAAVSLHIK